MGPLWQFFLTWTRLVRRNAWLMFFTFGAPLIFAVALGVAYSDETVAPSKVYAPAHLIEKLKANGIDALEAPDRARAERHVQRGTADALVVEGAPPQVYFAGGRPDSQLAAFRIRAALELPAEPAAAATVTMAPVVQVGGRYIDFLIPGLLGYNMFTSALFMLGGTLSEMRRSKLLRRLHPTPMPRSSMLLGFMFGQLAQSLVEICALLAFGYFLFDVTCAGNLPLFIMFSLLCAACFAGIGILLASRARGPEFSNGIANILLYPVVLLSGVFFSAERFPESAQPFLRLIPTRAALDGMRAIFNDAAGPSALVGPALVVFAWGCACMALGIRRFRWA